MVGGPAGPHDLALCSNAFQSSRALCGRPGGHSAPRLLFCFNPLTLWTGAQAGPPEPCCVSTLVCLGVVSTLALPGVFPHPFQSCCPLLKVSILPHVGVGVLPGLLCPRSGAFQSVPPDGLQAWWCWPQACVLHVGSPVSTLAPADPLWSAVCCRRILFNLHPPLDVSILAFLGAPSLSILIEHHMNFNPQVLGLSDSLSIRTRPVRPRPLPPGRLGFNHPMLLGVLRAWPVGVGFQSSPAVYATAWAPYEGLGTFILPGLGSPVFSAFQSSCGLRTDCGPRTDCGLRLETPGFNPKRS